MITETDTGYSSCEGHIKYTEIPLVPNHKWRGLYDRYLRYIINDEHHDFSDVVKYSNLAARDESWLIDYYRTNHKPQTTNHKPKQ